jgi:uncharacterized protein YndB with AHSA1/START domain
MTPDRIERDQLVAAPVVTKPEHLGRWFADSGATIDLRPGGELTLTWERSGTVKGIVEHVDAPHTFAFRWAVYGDEVNPGNSTLVTFTLRAESETSTRLTVVETGFAGLDVPELDRRRIHEDHTGGWATELGHLADHA